MTSFKLMFSGLKRLFSDDICVDNVQPSEAVVAISDNTKAIEASHKKIQESAVANATKKGRLHAFNIQKKSLGNNKSTNSKDRDIER